MWDEFLNMIFPERCVGCSKFGNALCAFCERTITTKPKALSGTTAVLFDYKNPLVKKSIWALKYHQRKSLGHYFGNALYREFFTQLARGTKKVGEEIILLPVPGSKKAAQKRGYNHAGIIAEAIARTAKADGLHLSVASDMLYKKRENPQQATTASKMGRKHNVENIFGIHDGHHLTGKTVILIDDVITTGATINEARRAVKLHKPKRILVIAVAH